MTIEFPRVTLARWLAVATLLGATPVFARAQSPATFKLSSPDVPANGDITVKHVFNGFGCTGQNVSPALAWSNAPAGTMSYAITVYDPDAPSGSGWWHWMVYDIPATVTSIPAGAGNTGTPGLPAGSMQGMTDFGAKGWGGPCPPAGDKAHRYVFTVFALKVAKLGVPATATSALIGFNLNAFALGKATFTAKYGR